LDEEQTPACYPITNTTTSIDVHVDDALSQKEPLSSSSCSPPIPFDVSKETPFVAIAPAPPAGADHNSVTGTEININQDHIHIIEKNRYAQRWSKRFEGLKVYFDANGHSNVPAYCKEHPTLGFWVSRQKTQYKKTLELLWEQFEVPKNRISTNENLIKIGKLNKLTCPMMLESLTSCAL
jgi:hypothetical protein